VLDNTAGSGTTAIAAIETGRNWICIEKDASYFQIAQERIREKLAQPFLPGIAEGQPVKVEQVKLFCD
jgi:site-specific DNA-methyltransferase (adenine-specific)